jgi:hypothetical protein
MEDHAFDDFKLKLDYLKSQYERLLSRFHYFLTVDWRAATPDEPDNSR